jgi:hypothetical protein
MGVGVSTFQLSGIRGGDLAGGNSDGGAVFSIRLSTTLLDQHAPWRLPFDIVEVILCFRNGFESVANVLGRHGRRVLELRNGLSSWRSRMDRQYALCDLRVCFLTGYITPSGRVFIAK